MAKKDRRTAAETKTSEEKARAETLEEIGRDEELSGHDDDFDKELLEIYDTVQTGYENQWTRSNDQMDYWDVYNCKLGQNQFYTGNAKIYVPIVHNAVHARTVRFANQLFPSQGRYVEVTSHDGTEPDSIMSLLEHYVRKGHIRTRVTPALLKNGDVEGQYTVYIGWRESKRHVVTRTKTPAPVDEEGLIADETAEIEDIEEATLTHARPHVEVIADADLLVLPFTADSINDALAQGGSVTILRRYTKRKLKQMIADEEIREDVGQAMIEEMSKDARSQIPDKEKKSVDAAGIKSNQHGKKFALVYETWHEMLLDTKDKDEKGKRIKQRRIVRSFFGSPSQIMSCKRNPNWSDKIPILSVPVEKVQGSFKGIAPIKPTVDMQYFANDATNEGADSLTYALMPIVLTDPEKNPRVGSMVLSLAAVWQADPKSTQFAKFPNLMKDALEVVANVTANVSQTLSVSPAAITQQATSTKSKRSQAEVALEQQVDILTTADAVTVLEEGIFTPMLQRFLELDHQHRDEDLTVRQFGQMGERAKMQKIAPVQWDRRYEFRWFGVEQARTQQQMQQQIGAMNVLRGIPPDQFPGRRINLVPLITKLVDNVFGPRLGPLIFEDVFMQMPVPADQENGLMMTGFQVPVHMMDDDNAHLQAHTAALNMVMANENIKRYVKVFQAHIWEHLQQAQKKAAAAAAPQMAGLPGAPGQPGQPAPAGGPRMGAVPGAPRGGQNPPGSLHIDQIGPASGAMPRFRNVGGM